MDALESVSTERGEYFSFRKQMPGRATAEILWEALPGIIGGIYFPKTMYWTGKAACGLYGRYAGLWRCWVTMSCRLKSRGLRAENNGGHRILGSTESIEVTHRELRRETARKLCARVSAADRRARIEAALGHDVQRDDRNC